MHSGSVMQRVSVDLDRAGRIYSATYVLVQLYRPFWVLAVLMFAGLLAVGAVVQPGQVAAVPMRTYAMVALMMVAYTAIAYLVGVAVCKLSRIPAIVILVYAAVAIPFLVDWTSLVAQSVVRNPSGAAAALPLFLGGALIVAYFGYLLWDFLWGAFWCMRASTEDRTRAAELYGDGYFSLRAFSKTIGLNFSIEHVRVRRVQVLALMTASSAMYTVFSAALLFGPAVVAMAIVLGTPTSSGRDMRTIGALMVGGTALVAALSLYFGMITRRQGRRRARSSLAELQHADPRPPVLFLRSFADDQVQLGRPRLSPLGRAFASTTRDNNLDVMLLDEGTNHGPVVALGNPNDPLPPYGAARGYFAGTDWQAGVAGLMGSASMIVVCLDDTPGVMWELERIARDGFTQKTLFLVHPRHVARCAGIALLDIVTRRLELDAERRGQVLQSARERSDAAVLGFFLDGDGVLRVGLSSTDSRFAYLAMLRWYTRSHAALRRA